MKEINLNKTEQALTMYKETVSPSKENLKAIFSHIPEQKKYNKGRAVRSPYIWIIITQGAMVCLIVFGVYPAFEQSEYSQNPFYAVDQQVEEFERGIINDDYERNLLDYTL